MPRLLVVDDEESICFSMSEYFSLHGYRVDTAQEFDEAEKLVEDMRQRLGHNTRALICHRHPKIRVADLCGDSNRCLLRRIFQGIFDQVGQQLIDQIRIYD